MDNNIWYKELLAQKFLNTSCLDPTKLLIASVLVQGEIGTPIPKNEVLEYIHSFYSDNELFAIKSPFLQIRNIKKYGLNDILLVLNNALSEWQYGATKALVYDNNRIWLRCDPSDGNIKERTQQIIKVLFKKYFNFDFDYSPNLKGMMLIADNDLVSLNLSAFRSRVFQDMQYCQVCDDASSHELYVVRIFGLADGATEEELTDKQNGLVLCREHADAYLNREFYFDENGFAYSSTHKKLPGICISMSLLKNGRRKYLIKRKNCFTK